MPINTTQKFPEQQSKLPDRVEPGTCGFVFAATGRKFNTLARRAARTMRLVMPDVQIDLFSDDASLEDDVFDRIHLLNQSGLRPKMEAMRSSRFERTIVLDADLVILADITELFDVLVHYELAGCPGQSRSPDMFPIEPNVPRSAPLINSGVLVARASKRIDDFMLAWEEDYTRSGDRFDQVSLRRLLYKGDIRFLTLGHEYNLKMLSALQVWSDILGAPRIIHCSALSKNPEKDPFTPYRLEEVVNKETANRIRQLISADRTLGGSGAKVRPIIQDLRAELRAAKAGWRDKTLSEQSPPKDL